MGRPSRSDDVLVVKGKLQQVLSVVLRWTCNHGRMMDTAHERRCTRCTRRRQALLDPGAYIDDQEQEATEDLDVKVTPTFSQQNGQACDAAQRVPAAQSAAAYMVRNKRIRTGEEIEVDLRQNERDNAAPDGLEDRAAKRRRQSRLSSNKCRLNQELATLIALDGVESSAP
ncbi:hypothetical protein PC121_g12278 [Phytophthora cactorum]|nr:hypothetical protein PC121_g12278 [Phytophthora cactorum]